ncbi:Flagellar biosynthetic protein FlhB [Candidatus Terasakiella magnetica]|nr:Flagellar biosynthetic protein FlhB [Candidatus Terasakiella magnetica]
MAEDSDDKTEEPTGKKLEQAREEGQIAQSQEVKIWAGLTATLAVVGMMSSGMASKLSLALIPFLEHPHDMPTDPAGLGEILLTLMGKVLGVLAFPVAVLMLAGLISNVAQNGLRFVGKNLSFKFSKISPAEGLKRMLSTRNLIEFGKALIKVIVVGFVVFWVMRARINEYVGTASVDAVAAMIYLRDQVVHLIFVIMIMVTIVAAADFFYQRWSFNERMKMSKQEVKDEHKQSEGDPMIKGRIRSLRMQRARQRMMSAVPKADVVVTNPTHFAVALKYDMEAMNAPVLVAKGADLIAKRIRELAEENEVPIVENPPLARALFATVELDQEVPPEHYKAVAEVIGYVMKLKGKLAN